jgi:hypothetical protein
MRWTDGLLSAHHPLRRQGPRLVHAGAVQPGRHVRPDHAIKFTLYDLPFRSFMEKHHGQADALHLQAARPGAFRWPTTSRWTTSPPACRYPMASTSRPTAKPGWPACTPTNSHRWTRRHGRGEHDQDAVQGAATPAERTATATSGSWPSMNRRSRAMRPEDRAVHTVRPARQPQGQRHALLAQRGPRTPPGLGERHQLRLGVPLRHRHTGVDDVPDAAPRHVHPGRRDFRRKGKAYVSSASFPSWHIEDAQPTLIEITPPAAAR